MNDERFEQIAKTILEEMPSKEEILKAITEGTRLAFYQVYGSDILNAIADGTKEALAVKKVWRT